MTIRYAAKTDVGRVRQVNEDSLLVREPLFAVADGMGGHAAGDVASKIAIETLTTDVDGAGDRDTLVGAVQRANSVIFERGQTDPTTSGMGTTCTVVYISGDEARFAHVGDSRAYLLRGGKLAQVTEDHTLVNRMVKEGRLRAEEAERHPQRNVITRALGIDSNVKVDYSTIDLHPGDRILICSDGLSGMLDATTIQRTLSEERDPQVVADRLIDLANDAGGEDNITAVIVDVTEAGGEAPPSRAAAPVREETPRPQAAVPPPEPVRATSSRRWPRRLVGWGLGLAVLGVGGYFLVTYLLSNAWFVGANDDGMVTIYQGIPEEIAGLDLKDEKTTSNVAVEDLPDFLQEDIEEGIKVDSEDDARTKVADLKERARELQDANGGGDGTRDRNRQPDAEKTNG